MSKLNGQQLAEMTAGQAARKAGHPSLEWVSMRIGKPVSTLRNWKREYPVLFLAVINGLGANHG